MGDEAVTVIECSRCGGVLVVPRDCAERVERGESMVLCETCIESVRGYTG